MEKNMKRVIIICNCKFPRGGALSNYIQYLSLAISIAGYDTIIVTDTNSEYISCQNKSIKYGCHNIERIMISNNKFLRHIQFKTGYILERFGVLRKYDLSASDVLIVFGKNRVFYNELLRFRKKRGFKIIGGLLEMFSSEDFGDDKHGYANYYYVLENIFPQFDAVMPISTYIEDHYKAKGIKTFCIPILADTEEFEVKEKLLDKYRFVLPANGKMKDALCEMLIAFSNLSQTELLQIELHTCGIKDSDIKKSLNDAQYAKLQSILHVHGWMKYDDLIELYQNMNFLILARKTSQMTLANFPSKVPETMGLGIVPVVSEVGDYTKYYLQNGIDSIFIDGYSPENCLLAIRKAINLSEQEYIQMSKNAIHCVKTKFDYHVWVDRISKMIEEV